MAKSTLGSLLIDIQLQTATLNKQVNGIGKKFDKMGNNLKKIVAGLAIGSLFKDLTTAGLKYNSSLETTRNSIAGLLVATSKLEDQNGNIITQQQLYNNAMSESVGILEELQVINSETPMGLDETAQIYKTMLPSMRQVGATQSELIELTKNLAIASGTAGLKTQQLLSGVDGLATGTVLANSELGRFLTALGLSNDELKKSKDVVGLLNEKLGKLKGEITMDTQLSTLKENWNATLGVLTKSLWSESKEWIQALTDFLNKFRKSIPDIAVYFKAAMLTIEQHWTLGLARLKVNYEEFMDTIRQTWEYLTSLGKINLSYNADLEWAKSDLVTAENNVKSFTRNMLNLYEAMPDRSESMKTVGNDIKTVGEEADKTSAKVKKLTEGKTKELKEYVSDYKTLMEDGFKTLESGMSNVFRSWMDGSLNWKEAMSNILKDILAQMVEILVIKRLISGISGSFGVGSVGGAIGMFAKGGAFSNGVQAFASGGVVSSPTLFPMASGMGLMGEAGAEAVMPLKRTASGNLGVEATVPPVTVNVNNYGSDNVEVEQEGDQINVIISKIASDITRGTGNIGQSMEARYGLRKV